MIEESFLVRAPGERLPPTELLIPIHKGRGRPTVEYRLKVHRHEDVELLRRKHLPLYLLTSERVTALGYPIRFPSELVVSRSLLSAVETSYRTIPFVSEAAVARPRIEDIALAFLTLRPIAARVLLERNRAEVDPNYLLKRVLTENLEEPASYARLFDLAPALPRTGPSIPVAALEREFRKNRPTGRIP
jgi:hypothetical protein